MDEFYNFTWYGKTNAVKQADTPTDKTMVECREESVNFDHTNNLFIEGDNLDALKLLREQYTGKVKMIYIDPPYNTGGKFLYKDNFNLKDKKLSEGDRRHAGWLNMMYPRLKIARELLRDDGVIFISIDDNEVKNLKNICDEIFGEKNVLGIFPTIMNLKGNNSQFGFSGTHEYTIVCMRNKNSIDDLNGLPLTAEDMEDYKFEDSQGKYKKGATLIRTGKDGLRSSRPKGFYPIYVSKSLSDVSVKRKKHTDIEVFPVDKNGREMSWRRSPENLEKNSSEIIVTQTANGIALYKKQRLSDDMKNGKKAKSLLYKPSYSSGNGILAVKEIFGGERFFDNPKPIDLIKDFTEIGTKADDLILDFFAGSATTAHAVMQRNAEENYQCQFIMVQLPEVCDEKSAAAKAGYSNIAEISKERIRRAAKQIKGEHPETKADLGFKVFKLVKPPPSTQSCLCCNCDRTGPLKNNCTDVQ